MENDSGVSRENSENHESREKPEAGTGKSRRYFTRHGYLRDFIRNDRGEYLYDGDVYCYNTPEIPFQSAFLRLLLLSCGAFLAQIPGGCFQSAGMRDSFYVVLHYVCALVSAGSLIWALVRLTSGGETLRAYVYKATVQALPGRAVLVMCAAGAGMLGPALCMIVHGTAGRLAGLLLCLLLKAALLAGAWLLRRYVQTLPWEGPPEETAD